MKRLLAVSLVLLAITSVAYAQTPDPLDQVYTIAKQLNCPTCGGRNLADCPTDTCTQWKQEIKNQLDTGKTPQQIIDYFLARFGPTVLQEPPKQGALLLLWTLPVVGLAALAITVVIVLKRSTIHAVAKPMEVQTGTAPLVVPTAVADRYANELEEEVRKAS